MDEKKKLVGTILKTLRRQEYITKHTNAPYSDSGGSVCLLQEQVQDQFCWPSIQFGDGLREITQAIG